MKMKLGNNAQNDIPSDYASTDQSVSDKIEILAPVGGYDMISAAVNCGANAVYLGFGSLNARNSAKNFGLESLRQAVDYCHIRNVSVYLTLNTLVFDNELVKLQNYIRDAANLGVDAVIVQDLATAKFVREICPSMPLHGSTQMSVNSLSGAKMLEEMGFKRVVLARELTKNEIANITKNVDIETEIFVHGAHCMSVSGQCTMSAMIGGRSGNRGMCAQPCRLPFGRMGGMDYNLSLKDMSIIYDLPNIKNMGVASLKIEGRMKRPEYVAAAVTACVSALDGESLDLQMNRLEKVFSRSGFTDGFYKGQRDFTMYGVRSKGDVMSAKDVFDELSGLYRSEKPIVPVRFEYVQKKDQPVCLTIFDNKGNTYTSKGNIPQVAINKPTDTEKVLSALKKLGGTPYYIEDVDCTVDNGLMVPVSEINKLRRECVESMDKMRSDGFVKEVCGDISDLDVKSSKGDIKSDLPRYRAAFKNKNSIPLDLLDEFEYIYLPTKLAMEMFQELENYKQRVILLAPRVMFGREDEILDDLKIAKSMGFEHICALNIGDLYWANRMEFTIHGGFGLNCVNSVSLSEYARLGCVDIEMSLELDVRHLNRIDAKIPMGITAYGHVPVMLTRNCPGRAQSSCANCAGNLEMYDRLGNKFHLSCGEYKTATEIYNCNPIYLGDKLDDFEKCDFVNFYFTNENSDTVRKIVGLYKSGQKSDLENITRGLSYRGIS